ncbi:MAG: ParA family protein [Clostridia bacterium]|nr:ParA family protein [Clostridia bacterium]
MATITTFFSYKGGAGRSTTCLNTIPFLAEELEAYSSSPILLLDMDIESAGMTYLLNKHDYFHTSGYDVKEFLKGEETWPMNRVGKLSDHPLYKKFVPVGNILGLEDNYAVMFLGVNDASRQLDRSDIAGRIEEVMSRFNHFAENNGIKAIVMDSAAGDQFSARLSVDNSDKIVFCMRPTHQFRIGTFNYLRNFARRWGRNADEKEFILLPTVVPADVVINGKSQLKSSVEDICERIEGDDFEYLDINSSFIDETHFGINEITRFKWHEDVLYKLNAENALTNNDELEGLSRYQALASAIAE